MTDTPPRVLAISLYESLRSPPVRAEVTLAELIDSLCSPEPSRGKEDSPAWSPITYSGDRRVASEAVAVSALVYDLDHATDADMAALGAALESRGWVWILHETWTPGRWRLVLPLARDLTPRDYPVAWESTRAALSCPADPSARDLARLYFVPSHPEGETRRAAHGGTVLLEPIPANPPRVEKVPNPPNPPKVETPQIPTTQPSGENEFSGAETKSNKFFDLESLRRAVAAMPRGENRSLLLEFLSAKMVLRRGSRDQMVHRIASLLANVRDAYVSPQVALALFEPILASMEGKDDEGEEHWRKKFSYSFERGLAHRASREESDAKVRDFFTADGTEATQWKERFVMGRGDKPAANLANLDLILENDADYAGHIRFNELRRQVDVTGGVLASAPRETIDTALTIALQRPPYTLAINRFDAGAAILHTARRHSYNPLQDYFDGLEWDGKPRITGALHTYCRCQGNDEYIQNISRKFFIGCVARALRPGCQLDTVLVLHGAQGLGKTTFVRVLGGDFSTETKLNVHDKDAVMVASSSWLVELSELASMRSAEIESVRSFLTTKTDRIRLPYAREVGEYPRRCAFVGTTNDAQALTDVDGNRRFWVVSVQHIDTDSLLRYRDQLWAEAKSAFLSGERWWLSTDEQKVSDEENLVYLQESALSYYLTKWVKQQKVVPSAMTAVEIATSILQYPPAQVTPQVLRSVNKGARQMGLVPTKVRQEGKALSAWKLNSVRLDSDGEDD